MTVTLGQVWTAFGVLLVLDTISHQATAAGVEGMLLLALGLTVAAWLNDRT